MITKRRGSGRVGGTLSLWPRQRGWSLLSDGTDPANKGLTFCLMLVYLGFDKNLCLLDSTQGLHALGFFLAVDFFAVEEIT